jgi:signal transduction histidine kinase
MANVLLALIFFGIALGTLRYRLFDVHWIWLRVLVWVFAGFLVLGVDLALAYMLNLNQLQILPLALLLAGWVYFPVRNRMIEWMFGDSTIKVTDHIPELLERFSSVRNQDEIDGRFVNFLQQTFKAQEVASIDPIPVEQARVENHGLFLRVPMVTQGRSVKLVGKANGRQLFSGAEKTAADSFLRLVRSIHDGNLREIQRLGEERRRITRDLHDDVGGKILSMIYQAPDKKSAEQAQDALQALKETVAVLEDAQEMKFDTAWTLLCEDMAESLEDVTFVNRHSADHRVLSSREFVNLKRIMQELTSNALKYALAKTLVVSTTSSAREEIVLRFENKIAAPSDTSLSGMRGLTNIKSRAEEMGGSVEIDMPAEGGTEFSLTLTLPSEPQS